MSSIFHSSNELRALILEHPELPIVFCCGNRDTAEAFTAKNMVWRVGEVLDTAGPDDEILYTDRETLADDIADSLQCENDYSFLSDEEFDLVVINEAEKYNDYWKPCILVELW